jgi:drug/metabolite transporter (DMT)-like permease
VSRARREPDRRGAAALLVLLTLVWGVHWVVVKVGLRDMPPFTYATLRVAGGLATLVVLLAVRGQLRLPARSDLPIVASVGLGFVATSIALMNLALQVVPAGRSSVLVYTMPLWVALIMAVFLRVRPAHREVLALGVGLVGIALLLNPAAIDWGSGGQLAGSAALLVSAVCWALTTIHVRRHRWAGTPLTVLPWQLLVALAPLAVLALLLENGRSITWGPMTVAVLLFSGPLATGFAVWANQSLTLALGPLVTGTALLGVPVVGLASGALLLGEPVSGLDLAGFALTLAGVALLVRPAGSVESAATTATPG